MSQTRLKPRCGTAAARKPAAALSLPVIAAARGVPGIERTVRPSRTSKWRAATLVAIHLIVIGHIVYWSLVGRTVSPVEPSEAMYTLNNGYLNAGFLFFAAAILATLLLGRFVCGWGCHFVAYQDFCAWAMKKVGVKPKAFRSRLLIFAPLALALYMFVWPTAYRWFVGAPRPPLSNHLMTTEFWATFPGPAVGILTVLLAGMAIVYFLGAKGFCTYACPYGGFFGLADQVAPGRILVTDDCEHCGHCTATCTSNVRVHEEVALYGMVVDPGCMKCMDCVSVCPNDALYFGFAKPPIGAKPKAPRKAVAYDFSLAEEGLMAIVGLAALLALRGLYDQVPLLLAMGLAAMTGFLTVKLWGLLRHMNVRLQNLQLKRGGMLTRAGIVFILATALWLMLTGHSAAVQYSAWRGGVISEGLGIPDEVWLPGYEWSKHASAEAESRLHRAVTHLERSDRWGLLSTGTALQKLTLLYVAAGRLESAEETVRRLISMKPARPELHRGLAGVLRKAGRTHEAEAAYRQALTLDPGFSAARTELGAMLLAESRIDDAVGLYREGITASPGDGPWRLRLAQLLIDRQQFVEAKSELALLLAAVPDSARGHSMLGVVEMESGELEEGLGHLRRAVALDPSSGDANYNLGMALLNLRRIDEAVEHLGEAARLSPDNAIHHYNLAVATFMSGHPAEAMPHIRNAIRLAPNDPQAHGFLAVVLEQLGDTAGAQVATEQAQKLRVEP